LHGREAIRASLFAICARPDFDYVLRKPWLPKSQFFLPPPEREVCLEGQVIFPFSRSELADGGLI
jgi:hypothetical protein